MYQTLKLRGQQGKIGTNTMTNQELIDLLSFESELESAEILNQTELAHDATFVLARLIYFNNEMIVPFVHYTGQDWLFTPCDWQGWLPETPENIDRIGWRVNGTDTEAVMFDGLPMLAPWVSEPKDINRETRKRIGEQIKDARETQGLSIRALAERTGVDKGIICRIEAGRTNTTLDTLNSLAVTLGLTINLD